MCKFKSNCNSTRFLIGSLNSERNMSFLLEGGHQVAERDSAILIKTAEPILSFSLLSQLL